jgi:hypothetical protein
MEPFIFDEGFFVLAVQRSHCVRVAALPAGRLFLVTLHLTMRGYFFIGAAVFGASPRFADFFN